MKRFYEKAEVRRQENGLAILLDGRPIRTPGKLPLAVPGLALAQAIAYEWQGQGEQIDPRSMPLTGLANAAIERIAPNPDPFARALAAYGESDLLCYRAETPDPLVARQTELWEPLLAWARGRFDVDFEIVCGIVHRTQSDAAVERLARAVAALDAFELACLSPLVTISGSLIIALALAEGAVDLEVAWSAASLDEIWQIEKWGADAEAVRMLEGRRQEFEAAYRFLSLYRSPD